MKNFYDVLIYLLYITDGFKISLHLCTKLNMVSYLIAFPIYLSAKVLHTRYGIVTSHYHVLELHASANTLLYNLGHPYGQNLP